MTNHILRIFTLVLVMITNSWCYSAPQPISQVDIIRSGFLYNRQTDTFDTTITIRNAGTVTLAAPMRLVLESVQPVSISLYNMNGKTILGKPYVDVPLPDFVVDPGKSATVPVRFVNLGRTVTAATFSVEAERLDPAATARLNIIAKLCDECGGNPVNTGFKVKIDGITRALTDNQGRASFMTTLGASEVSVSYPPNYSGTALIPVRSSGETNSVTIEVDDSKEVSADSILRMDRLQHMMLPTNAPLIVLRFYQNEKPVTIDIIEQLELHDTIDDSHKDIANLFAIQTDGSLIANATGFFSAIRNLNGKKMLSVAALDKLGTFHDKEITFYVSNHTIQGKLSAPPSNPSLSLGGIPIQVSVLNTDIAFTTESAADGTFPLPLLPSGNLLIKAVISSGGVFYIGQGTVVISGNLRIDIKMRGPSDVSMNVAPIAISPL